MHLPARAAFAILLAAIPVTPACSRAGAVDASTSCYDAGLHLRDEARERATRHDYAGASLGFERAASSTSACEGRPVANPMADIDVATFTLDAAQAAHFGGDARRAAALVASARKRLAPLSHIRHEPAPGFYLALEGARRQLDGDAAGRWMLIG